MLCNSRCDLTRYDSSFKAFMNGKVPVICLLVCHVNTKHKDSMEVSLELRDVKMQYSHDLEVRKTRKIRQSQMPPSWIFCFLWFCNPSLSISSAFYLLQHQVTCFLWPVRHSVSKYFSSHTFIEVTTSLIGNKHVFPIWLFSIL